MLYNFDNKGFIINIGNKGKLQKTYLPMLNDASKLYEEQLKDLIIGIYVRGSISSGLASSYSDLDMLAIVNRKMKKSELLWTIKASKELEKKYHHLIKSGAELDIVFIDDLLKSDKYINLRINLAVQSICLKGKNILPKISRVKPSRNLALLMHKYMKNDLRMLRRIFASEVENPSYLYRKRPVQFWCIWMCRVLIRSCAGILMLDEPFFTKDMPAIANKFIPEYGHEKEMKQMLKWAIKPSTHPKVLLKFLNNFAPMFEKTWQKAIRKER